ncbi:MULTISPECIES: hypothetical protein [Oceanobacillus]|uniref:Uncharacterized protein n=1 Tax=Oceanobacillus kimchii TaxID=746691 RepID=A0ABQ5TQS9_9BACI|nr:hypothetical protein [Oceanobacillus kimchii]GLO68279.1 hypothetical protein MACH08_40630 [Oceanobacillus kimchii]
MERKPRILIGVANEYISDILRKYLVPSEHFHIIEQEVMHMRFMEEVLDSEQPDILIVHDVFLPSEKMDSEERQQEWLSFLHFTRQRYNDLRIVFLCERSKEDIFLNQLIGLGIQDIFNNSSINMEHFIKQLSLPAKYSNVAKFRTSGTTATVNFQEEYNYDESEEELVNETLKPGDEISTEQESKTFKKRKNRNEHKIETREVIVEKPVERLIAYPLSKKIILVGSPFSRSGSTFVSHLIAKEMAHMDISVTYVENPFQRGYAYDRFDGHRKTENYRSVFHSYLKNNKPEPPITYEWSVDGVEMIVKHPSSEVVYDESQIDFELFIKVLLTNKSAVTIVDVGNDWDNKTYQDLLEIASDVIMVVEPDISNIQYLEDPNNSESDVFRQVLELDKTMFVGNRFSDILMKNKLLKDLYGTEVEISIPQFPIEAVFECQEKATFLNSHTDFSEEIEGVLHPLLELLLPENLFQRKKKKGRLLQHIFQKRSTVN